MNADNPNGAARHSSGGAKAAGPLAADIVTGAVYDAVRTCAVTLRPDFRRAIEDARAQAAPAGRAAGVLDRILENARIGAEDAVPICQDTGSVWVCLEVGEELAVPGNIFSGVNDAVARAYTDGALRMSLVRDALFDRANTRNNTPAFCELKLVPGARATLHVLLKGGGSDNASRVVMLPPGARPSSSAWAWAPPSTRWRGLPSTPCCARWEALPPAPRPRPSRRSCSPR